MKKFLTLSFIFLISIQAKDILPLKPWTTYIYYSGQNDLSSYLQTSLNSLPQGANNNVNIVASYNGFSNTSNLTGPITQRYIVNAKNKLEEVGKTQKNTNAALPQTLINELTWAIQEAPSTSLAIFLAGDGNGIGSNNDFLSQITGAGLKDTDIQNALSNVIKLRNGKKVDVLALDTSYTSLEYYIAFADYANYVVASQDNDPRNGIPYNLALQTLKKASVDTKTFATNIVDAFKQTYSTDFGQQQFTLSAIDSSKVKSIAQNIDSTATILLGLLQTNKNDVKNLISKTIGSSKFFNNVYLDLNDFYSKLIANIGSNKIFDNLKTNLTQGISLIKQAVIKNGTIQKNASGISINAPLMPGKFCCNTNYLTSYFNQNYPNWAKFLQAYLAG